MERSGSFCARCHHRAIGTGSKALTCTKERRAGDVAELPVPGLWLLPARGGPVRLDEPESAGVGRHPGPLSGAADVDPPHRSTARAQPWLEVPGTAASFGFREYADTCAASER